MRRIATEDLDQLRDALLDASLIIDSQGLVRGYGHISARAPGQDAFLVTPRRALGLLSDPDDMLMVDFEGTCLEGDGEVPIEVHLHAMIYRSRSDVGAIVRTHSKHANVLGILGRPPRPVHGFGSFLGSEVPIFASPQLIDSPQLAREAATALGAAEALLLRGNGDVVVGRSVQEATVKAIFLEESCELQYLAQCAGQPTYLTPDELAIRRDPGYDHYARAWAYLRENLYAESELDE